MVTYWFPFPNAVLFPLQLLVDHLLEVEKGQVDETQHEQRKKIYIFQIDGDGDKEIIYKHIPSKDVSIT